MRSLSYIATRRLQIITTSLLLASSIVAHADSTASARPPWTLSRLHGTPDPPLPFRTVRTYPSIQFHQTTAVRIVPTTPWILVADTSGRLHAFLHSAEGREHDTVTHVVLDLQHKSLDPYGILDFTFHPKFPEEPWCFLTYGTKPQSEDGIHLSRFQVKLNSEEPPQVIAASERPILQWPNTGHSGGCIRFGPDGYLYAVIGDGAGPNPPDARKTGQDLSDLLSSMLRIDIDDCTDATPYRVPVDNPFVQMEGAQPEIWAYGFRNPWKFCFEARTGALWVADVGWDTFEPIYRVTKGGNYGWSITEGSQPVRSDVEPGPTPILSPVVEHSHLEARSITGGEFYYGTRIPELQDALIYGDWQTGKVWGLKFDGDRVTYHRELVDTPLQVICFFIDPVGDICLVGYDGSIYRLETNDDAYDPSEFPRRLSETGLFASTVAHEPAKGVLPYSVIAEPWADATTAERLVALPGSSQLAVFAESNWEIGQVAGHISFPHDAVLAKTIYLEMEVGNAASRRRIETQVLHRHHDTWHAYNYIWNDEQTDAELADNASDRAFQIQDPTAPGGVRQQTWHHASRSECLMCHVWSSGSVLGFKLHQLNGHPNGSGNTQLTRFAEQELFSHSLPQVAQEQVSPWDSTADLNARARAYLHINCSQCHRSEGGGVASFNARQTPSLDETNLINARPMQGDFGISAARLVVPGSPTRSLLLYRMSKLGRGRMPHLGSTVIDASGLQLMRDWIRSLGPEVASAAASDAEREGRSAVARLQANPLPAEETGRLVEKALESPGSAFQLLCAIDDGSCTAEIAQRAVLAAADNGDSRVRDLFQRFVPESDRVKRLGTEFDVNSLLAMRGSSKLGRQLILESGDLSCRNCHPIRGVGKMVGPDLHEIGKRYDRAQILEHILYPSKKIDEKYQTHVVLTEEGRVVSGLLIDETDGELHLRDAAGKDVRIALDEIESHSRNAQSLMPDQQLRDLTAQQAADLLEFLTTLKGS